MGINKPLVERKVTLILDDLPRIAELAALSLEDHLAEPRNEVLAERYLERTVGRVIDVNYHLVTEILATTPKSYTESFLMLVPAGVLDRTAATDLARLAGLRNRITHEYNGIDERIVHASLATVAADLPGYLRAVKSFCASR